MLKYEVVDRSRGAFRFLEKKVPVLIIIIIVVLLFGSNSLPGLGQRLGEKARKPLRQAKWMYAWASGTEEESLRAEREYGSECAREFSAQFSGAPSIQDQALIDTIGSKLAAAVKDSRRKFSFSVILSSVANAYALPGGFVFITKPLLDLCERNRDAVAFFLGHEIGHVVFGHAKDQLTANTILNAVATRFAGVGSLLHQLLSKGYSRSLELDADREAVRLMASAGFDPRASRLALRCLEHVAPSNAGLAEYFSSHPLLADRIRALE
jgi:predicted Zn-dependent protease